MYAEELVQFLAARILSGDATDQLADNALVHFMGVVTSEELSAAFAKGRHGWWSLDDSWCNNKMLEAQLHEHLAKGEMVAVINVAAMIEVRSRLYGDMA